ncbi:MerR family transcriptional regulator [Clostridioides difficile]|uniref:MerR family transcriptional regulator n=1 Tax=Clostridioides difficile TaxID=1496 RepID=UPI000BB1A19C|nr:MerR family transcriptional regulator [Clostridioides difficile]PBI40969.1 MerR family transcriptional regulator [Clostridioides difficile]
MSQVSKNYFTTGEFAKICGINKKTLFHYDDIGLFSPELKKENGYRYYSYHQLSIFGIISSLREVKMPLKEIKTYIDKRTPNLLIELLEKKTIDIKNEIEKLNNIQALMESTISFTKNACNIDANTIILKEHEEEYLVKTPIIYKEQFLGDEEENFLYECINFMDNYELSDDGTIGSIIKGEDIINKDFESYSYLFTKVNKEYKKYPVSIKAKGLYVTAYHKGSYETIYKTYEKLLNFFNQNNLCMGDFVYEEYLLYDISVRDSNEYLTQISAEVKM